MDKRVPGIFYKPTTPASTCPWDVSPTPNHFHCREWFGAPSPRNPTRVGRAGAHGAGTMSQAVSQRHEIEAQRGKMVPFGLYVMTFVL